LTAITGTMKQDFTLVRDPIIDYPSLYMEVCVIGDIYEQEAFANWLVLADCTLAETPEKADLVIFTGGADVSPELYNAPHHKTTFSDALRDKSDIEVFRLCVEQGIPMLGVCRGAQLGAVLHGATLYQDVDNHYKDHTMWDTRTKRLVHPVSSVHHQMVMHNDDIGMEVLGYSRASRKRSITDTVTEESLIDDIEAFWFEETGFFGVQGHPEYSGYPYYSFWVCQYLDNLFNMNPRYTLKGNLRRMTKKAKEKSTYDLDKILANATLPWASK